MTIKHYMYFSQAALDIRKPGASALYFKIYIIHAPYPCVRTGALVRRMRWRQLQPLLHEPDSPGDADSIRRFVRVADRARHLGLCDNGTWGR